MFMTDTDSTDQPPLADLLLPVTEETQVEIHKPKPVHNWREFLKEVGIIVLGVCIALGAEQAVEWLHWHDRVAATRRAIASETATNLSFGIMRMRRAPCMEKRLDEWAQILDAASESGNLPPVGEFGNPQNKIWGTAEWESLMSSGTAAHFPHDELAGMNLIYVYVTRYNDRVLQEVDTIAQLDAMAGPGGRLLPESLARLRDALSHARLNNRAMANYGLRIWQMASQQKIAFSGEDLRLIHEAQRDPIACPIMRKPAANYGQGPWDFVLPAAEDMLKHPLPLQVAE
jgi:hypothetical protein